MFGDDTWLLQLRGVDTMGGGGLDKIAHASCHSFIVIVLSKSVCGGGGGGGGGFSLHRPRSVYTLETNNKIVYCIIGERERANLVVQLARFFYIYIYIYPALSVRPRV